jgi:uncharacterized protein (DUF1778 family)
VRKPKANESTQILERLETRVSPADRARIGAAAKAAHESVAHLLHRAALKGADDILGREVDVTRLPASEYEALLAARSSRHIRR